jgi:hypothetical protein
MSGPAPDSAAENYAAHVAHNYGAPPITLVKGQGSYAVSYTHLTLPTKLL